MPGAEKLSIESTADIRIERGTRLRLAPNPGSPTAEGWADWVANVTRPCAVDLFSGCGGMSLGLQRAGFEVVLGVDHDPWALETHRHNFAGQTLEADLGDKATIRRLIAQLRTVPIDLIAAGPPCQPFSVAGQPKIRSLVTNGLRPIVDPRARLWRTFLNVVLAVRPRAVLLENVPQMALGDELTRLRTISESLRADGYDVYARVLPAWEFGVPQHRRRMILVALLEGSPFRWPVPLKRVTLEQAIGDLPRLGSTSGTLEMCAGSPATAFQKKAREGMSASSDVVWDHITRRVRTDDRAAFRMMKAGTRYDQLPDRLRRYRSDIFTDKYHRLAWDGLSRSITAHIAKDGYWYIHPSEHRTLTVREAARIQTFPDHFRFAGTRTSAFEQIGNAVPPALAEAVGFEIRSALARPSLPKGRRPSSRLYTARKTLLEWARADKRRHPWRHPGDLWAATVGAILQPRHRREIEFADALVREFPSAARYDGRRIRRVLGPPGRRLIPAVRSLGLVARQLRRNAGAGADVSRIGRSGLSAAAHSRLRALALGEEVVFTSTATRRVLDRFHGVWPQENGGLADGRMRLAGFLGIGHAVPRLSAALDALGNSVCTPRAPRCGECPLVNLCPMASARQRNASVGRHPVPGSRDLVRHA